MLEYNTLVENGTWEIVDLPEGQKAIGSGWVLGELVISCTLDIAKEILARSWPFSLQI
jgi:hypothetical protein